jgi:hypothetical protein
LECFLGVGNPDCQLLLTVQMRSNFTVVAAAAVLTVVVGKDFSFDQDIAFRATYVDHPQVADWPTTPFSNLLLKDSAAHLNVKSGDCFAIMQEGVLYTTQRQPLTSKLAMANPLAAWASVLTLNDGTDAIIASSPDDKFDLYAVTSTNIVGLTFDSGAGCGKIADEQTILPSAVSWGDVLALTASSGYLWVASSGQGLSQVNLADGTVTSIVLPDMTIRSITFVSKWNKLFVGTNTALYTLKFHSSTPGDYLLHHEWITGVIDTVPLQFSYDAMATHSGLLNPGLCTNSTRRAAGGVMAITRGHPLGTLPQSPWPTVMSTSVRSPAWRSSALMRIPLRWTR